MSGEKTWCPHQRPGYGVAANRRWICKQHLGVAVGMRVGVRVVPRDYVPAEPSFLHQCVRCGELLEIRAVAASAA